MSSHLASNSRHAAHDRPHPFIPPSLDYAEVAGSDSLPQWNIDPDEDWSWLEAHPGPSEHHTSAAVANPYDRLPSPNFDSSHLHRNPHDYPYFPSPLDPFDGFDIDEILSDEEDDEIADIMASSSRRQLQSQRGIVDLTNGSPPPSAQPTQTPSASTQRTPISLKRSANGESASQANRPHKRSRLSPSSSTRPSQPHAVEELDLTNEAPSAEEELLRNEREALIAAQTSSSSTTSTSGPLKLGKRTCIICMEPYTNATLTHCGHIYCHECLTQALMAGEKNSERSVGNCPVCRKPVSRKKAGHMIPLSFMTRGGFRGKVRRGPGL